MISRLHAVILVADPRDQSCPLLLSSRKYTVEMFCEHSVPEVDCVVASQVASLPMMVSIPSPLVGDALKQVLQVLLLPWRIY